ncbi:uncharacterized protein BDV14DRAFT_151936 [Aspergillus stella-maris]|uniref:uncharacterized protein n=1 Tax=Aspergillus stella-maris TaxID=1810926 RepID=UPI003CCDEDCF
MECKEHYPADFKAALARTPLQNGEIEALCSRFKSRPIFVYDQLMIPTILKYFAGDPDPGTSSAAQEIDIIPARLPEHKLHYFTEAGEPGLPVMVPSRLRSDEVQGMLVFGLTNHQCRNILEFECSGSNQHRPARVRMQVSFNGKVNGYDALCQRSVEARTLIWMEGVQEMSGLLPMVTTYWPIDDFIAGKLYKGIVDDVKREERLRDNQA